MRLIIAASGRRAPPWADQVIAEYQKRLARCCPMVLLHLPTAKNARRARHGESGGGDTDVCKLLRATSATRCIALARTGIPLDTMAVATRLRQWRQHGGDTVFLIGDADGLSPRVLSDATECWSLSKMTMAHALARVVLAEQLYRAHCIVQGLPYHR